MKRTLERQSYDDGAHNTQRHIPVHCYELLGFTKARDCKSFSFVNWTADKLSNME